MYLSKTIIEPQITQILYFMHLGPGSFSDARQINPPFQPKESRLELTLHFERNESRLERDLHFNENPQIVMPLVECPIQNRNADKGSISTTVRQKVYLPIPVATSGW